MKRTFTTADRTVKSMIGEAFKQKEITVRSFEIDGSFMFALVRYYFERQGKKQSVTIPLMALKHFYDDVICTENISHLPHFNGERIMRAAIKNPIPFSVWLDQCSAEEIERFLKIYLP